MKPYDKLNEQIEIYKHIYNKEIINYLLALINLDIPATYHILDNKFQIEELKKNPLFNEISAYNIYNMILQEMEKYDLNILKQNNKFGIKNQNNKVCDFVYYDIPKLDLFASQGKLYTDIILKLLKLNNEDFQDDTEYDSRLDKTIKIKKLVIPCAVKVNIK